MGKGPCWARAWLKNQRVELGPKGQVQEVQEVEFPNSRGPLIGIEGKPKLQKKESKQYGV